MLTDSHRRKLESITEETPFGYGGDDLVNLLTRHGGTIEYELRFFIPESAVSRHRFVVEVKVIEQCAEEGLRDLYDLVLWATASLSRCTRFQRFVRR